MNWKPGTTMPNSVAHWLLIFSALLAVSFFCIGLTSYFERRSDLPWWVRLIHNTGMLLSLSHLAGVVIFRPRSEAFAAIGVAMYTVAVLLFLSAIEAATRSRLRLQRSFVDGPLPERLLTEGPYRWVRHPFYLGYIVGAMAPAVAIGHPVLIAIAGMMIAFTVIAAFREERVWLSSVRGDAYREYSSRTGMFFPTLTRSRRSSQPN
jgi:protein-S-isoprenylcysteine O-methyltransferase Ste14